MWFDRQTTSRPPGILGGHLNAHAALQCIQTSTWLALKNPVFLRIWIASVLSATFMSAQEIAATWLMHDLGASFSLSLVATATSTPLLLFALPAGILADMASRRVLMLCALAWQAAFAGLLAAGAWANLLSIHSVLFCVFALGIGIAFSAPVWSAIVPDIVSKEELSSAVTLGGVQANLAGIVGPALGGLLLLVLGPPTLIFVNVATLLIVGVALLTWKPVRSRSEKAREGFAGAFLGSLRYAAGSAPMKAVLLRNFLFSLAISAIPAIFQLVIYTELQGSPAQLGFALTCVASGSLTGAVLVLPFLRRRMSSNAITLLAMGVMPPVLAAMAIVRHSFAIPAYAVLVGIAWAVAGSELWLVGQQAVSGRVRGRMNAFLIMAGQGGIALGSVLLAAGASQIDLGWTLGAAAVVALLGFGLGCRFSIDCSGQPRAAGPPLTPTDDGAIGYCSDVHWRLAGYEKSVEKKDCGQRKRGK
ncbi:MAG TPA: MFS transporter [Terrimicrobiaceae bacterium]|nr:MFS transporter [Terrimicrobiaceae bacterium]